ncbi:MAG: MFS transporter [Armatimonadota bacterium]|nr:MAG: MFS transporter [Armatimonadota bacterium]
MEPEETHPTPPSKLEDEQPALDPPGDADGDPGWRLTLYAAWVAQLFCIIGFSFVMPFFPFYIRDLGVPDRVVPIWAGFLATAGGITMTAAGPLWGMVADRYGRKLMVQRAMFGGAVVLGMMGLARNVYQLLALRFLQGTITGTVPASIALVSSVTPKNRMGYSLGLMQMAVFTGASVGPWLGGAVADRFGYRVPFAVTGALLFCGGLLVLFGTRERFKRPEPHEAMGAGSIRGLLSLRGVVTLLLVYFMLSLSGSIVGPIFPLFVESLMKTPERAASITGMLLAIGGIVAALASVTIGRSSDRFGHRRVLILTISLAGLFCFPQAVVRTVGQLLAIRILFGFAAGGMAPTVNALVTNIVPRSYLGRTYGLTTSANSLGMALGPSLGGWLAAAAGLRFPFVLMGAMLLLLALMVHQRVSPATTSPDAPDS